MRVAPLRSALTMLGIVLGFSSVIMLVALGQGMRTRFDTSFAELSQAITVYKSPTAMPGTTPTPLRESDIEALRRSGSPDIAGVTPMRGGYGVIRRGADAVSTTISGTGEAYLRLRNRELATGRMVGDQDDLAARRVAVVGATVVNHLFDGDGAAAVGAKVRIGRMPFEVVGVLAPQHDYQDNLVLVPLGTVRDLVGGGDTLTGIGVIASSAERVPAALDEVTRILDREHDIRAPGARDYRATALAGQLERISRLIRLLTLFTVSVAAVALFVGALGLANIMLVTVTERTGEIGVRKALGARRVAILRQFLVEAVTLSGVGGLLGVGLGLGATLALAPLVPRWQPELGVPELSVPAALCAFGVSLAIGVAAGSYPALRAARMHPIDALRY